MDLSMHTIRASPNGSDDAQLDQERGRRADGQINDTHVQINKRNKQLDRQMPESNHNVLGHLDEEA